MTTESPEEHEARVRAQVQARADGCMRKYDPTDLAAEEARKTAPKETAK